MTVIIETQLCYEMLRLDVESVLDFYARLARDAHKRTKGLLANIDLL